MKKKMIVLALLAAQPLAAQVKETNRLDACLEVLREVLDMPEGIPRELLAKAECVMVIPSVKKFALGFGGRLVKGAAVCRTAGRGGWGPPLMISIGGGHLGAPIGRQADALVFLSTQRTRCGQLPHSPRT